jgi:hypothetical protein
MVVLVWTVISLGFWAFYIAFVSYTPQFLYFFIWTAGVGSIVWLRRDGIERAVRAIKLGETARFVLLGCAMVLAEEVVAAFVNNLSEGFTLRLFAVRILQFWSLNIFAFTGLILAWAWMSRWLMFSRAERFYLTGLFGLYAERTIFVVFSNPLAFLLFAPLEILTYGLILTPAQLSVPAHGSMKSLRVLRYAASLLLPLLVSIPFVVVLMVLRAHFPWAFPPTKFIP